MAEYVMPLMEATIPTFKSVHERGYCLWGSFPPFPSLPPFPPFPDVVDILMTNLTLLILRSREILSEDP